MNNPDDEIEALRYMLNKMRETSVGLEQEIQDLRERISSVNCRIKLLEYIKEQNGK